MGVFAYVFGTKNKYGFSSSTTSTDVMNANGKYVTGKTFVITGANTGLGLEASKALASQGAHVVMACRSPERGQKALEEVKSVAKDANVQLMELDLSSFASVRKFADEIKSAGTEIDVLINNAGIMGCPHNLTVDGNEAHFGTNHLGHFLLTNLLLPQMRGTEEDPGRIVILASYAHTFAYPGGIRFDDLKGENKYVRMGAYGQSKLANILHARALERRLREAKRPIHAYSLHPGAIITNLYKDLNFVEMGVSYMASAFFKSVPQGTATTLFCASDPRIKDKGGLYFSDCCETDVSRKEACSDEVAERLWKVSAETTGSDFA
eukprot:Rmarinus@m.18171